MEPNITSFIGGIVGELFLQSQMKKVYFLSRPRCFVKSLLLSTLEVYFLSKRKLFDGLAIASLEEE